MTKLTRLITLLPILSLALSGCQNLRLPAPPPRATGTVAATASAVPTATPLPSATPAMAADTLTPTVAPSPTPAPTLTETPSPMPAPTDIPTRAPTRTPRATRTPRPTRIRPTPRPPLPTATLAPPATAIEGYPDWRGEYFNNATLTGAPAVIRNDGAVNFNWGTGAPAGQIAADNFSARWTRRQYFDAATYRFSVTVDDGARLFIDGAQVIDEWRTGGARTASADLALAAGNHDIRLEFFERADQALIQLRIEAVAVVNYTAWRGDYYSNAGLSGSPAMSRNDADINFDWGIGSPDPRIPTDNFSVRWTRGIYFDADTYRFTLRMDDGARLYVDGVLVIDQWQDGGARDAVADLAMSAGNHTLRVDYYERSNQAMARLLIERVGTPNITEWRGEYYNNTDLSGAARVVRNDSSVNFDWGTGSPDSRIQSDNFSARWTRPLYFNGGTYRFTVTADDGARLWVDGNLILDSWKDAATQNLIADRAIGTGNHDVRLEYFDHFGGALIRFSIGALNTPVPSVTPVPPPNPPVPLPPATPIPPATVVPTPA